MKEPKSFEKLSAIEKATLCEFVPQLYGVFIKATAENHASIDLTSAHFIFGVIDVPTTKPDLTVVLGFGSVGGGFNILHYYLIKVNKLGDGYGCWVDSLVADGGNLKGKLSGQVIEVEKNFVPGKHWLKYNGKYLADNEPMTTAMRDIIKSLTANAITDVERVVRQKKWLDFNAGVKIKHEYDLSVVAITDEKIIKLFRSAQKPNPR